MFCWQLGSAGFVTWFKLNAAMESCSLWMIRTGSGADGSGCGSTSSRALMDLRLPNTALMKTSCTGSWWTRYDHNRRAADDELFVLKGVFWGSSSCLEIIRKTVVSNR